MRRFLNSSVLRIAAGFALAAALLLLLGWLVTGPEKAAAAWVDNPIRSYVRQLQSPLLTSFFLAVTRLGSTLYLSVIGVAAGLTFIILRQFWALVLFGVIMAGQAVLHLGTKFLIARPRPSLMISYPNTEGSSFPSGHALSSLCLYLALAWIVSNRLENSAGKAGLWTLALLLVLLIGLSRVYMGVHYPTDIIAGFVGGALWTAGVMLTDRNGARS